MGGEGMIDAAQLQRVHRAHHPHWPLVEHMRVDHGGLHFGVAEQRLHGADVLPRLQQMRGEAETVRREPYGQTRLPKNSSIRMPVP